MLNLRVLAAWGIRRKVARKGTELSVFRGREAKLNRVIFKALAAEEPQSTRALHKKIVCAKGMRGTSYSTVNKRVRSLEGSGYIKKAEVKERPGGITNYYELTPRARLAAFLDSIAFDNLLSRISDGLATTLLEDLIKAATLTETL